MSSLPGRSSSGRSPLGRWREVTGALAPFGRRHVRWLVSGALAALVVVGIRLVLPWPLRALMEPWLGEAGGKAAGMLALVPAWLDATLAMGGAFLILVLSLGFADYIERLYFARFSIGTIRDVRAEAFRKAVQIDPQARAMGSGDLVARLIGDTARIKTGLKGFLVHVATNGVMFLGVTIVLLWINPTLGSIFLIAGLLVGVATTWGAYAMFRAALKFRNKEGRLANFIHESWEDDSATNAFSEVNRSSGEHEANLTRIQGITTWTAHVVLGIAVVAALWVGTRAVSAGRLAPGDLLVVMMYALMIRAPIVQLARQGARTGKIMACGDRLERLLSSSPDVESKHLSPLRDELRIAAARVVTKRARRRVALLGPIDLTLRAGQRVAILGKPGSGKTTLLELIAGVQKPKSGRLLWDGHDFSEDGSAVAMKEIAFLPHSPNWPRRTVRQLLNLDDDQVADDSRKLLRACGANSLLKRLPDGLDTKIAASDLSPRERGALALARLVRSDASLWLVDDPVGALTKRKARKVIKRILKSAGESTVVVTLGRPVRLKRFDRVVSLKKGKVAFDGTPAQWRTWVNAKAEKHANKDQNAEKESASASGQEGVL